MPPREQRADAFAAEAFDVAAQRGDAGRARAFGDELLIFEQIRDRAFDRRFGDEQHVAHHVAQDRERNAADAFDRDALGDRHAADVHVLALELGVERRIELGLDADHFGLRPERFDREHRARDQAAAADRDHDRIEVGAGIFSSSSVAVAWPAMTFASSYGWISVAPVCSTSA